MPDREVKYLPFRDIVLIADIQDPHSPGCPFHMRRDLEKSEATVLDALFSAFDELGLRVHHYEDPGTLSSRAKDHQEDLVFTIYGGEASRSRLALVPAVCEAHGLSYVGPDAYGSIICHDKEVSKHLARDCGLQTPRHRVVRAEEDLDVINLFSTPLVVKPLSEGSSIGISQGNLIKNKNVGIKLAKELLYELRQPVLIEDFVPGREVSFNCIEGRPDNFWSYSEIHVEGQENYFDTHLFDAEEKYEHYLPRRVVTIDSELPQQDHRGFCRLLNAIGKFGYCRIDGKHLNGRFVFLEITPDAWIGPTGAFAASFINKGWKYADIIYAVLASAASNLLTQ